MKNYFVTVGHKKPIYNIERYADRYNDIENQVERIIKYASFSVKEKALKFMEMFKEHLCKVHEPPYKCEVKNLYGEYGLALNIYLIVDSYCGIPAEVLVDTYYISLYETNVDEEDEE